MLGMDKSPVTVQLNVCTLHQLASSVINSIEAYCVTVLDQGDSEYAVDPGCDKYMNYRLQIYVSGS